MMKKRSTELNRKDIVTNNVVDRNSLIRISIDKKGNTQIDKEYNLGGRGIYILPTSINIGLEKNILQKNIKRFGGDINQIIEQLKEEVK